MKVSTSRFLYNTIKINILYHTTSIIILFDAVYRINNQKSQFNFSCQRTGFVVIFEYSTVKYVLKMFVLNVEEHIYICEPSE